MLPVLAQAELPQQSLVRLMQGGEVNAGHLLARLLTRQGRQLLLPAAPHLSTTGGGRGAAGPSTTAAGRRRISLSRGSEHRRTPATAQRYQGCETPLHLRKALRYYCV